MDPRTFVIWIFVGAVAAWGAWYLRNAYLVWKRLHGARVVTCPETGQPAAVRFDIASAVTSKSGVGTARLESCSRWDERGPCEQPCAHAAEAPESAASAIVTAWIDGRHCATCGHELVELGSVGHHVALLDASGVTREWVDIAADRLPLALSTSVPICWDCHVAETLRRLHPELVTERNDEVIRVKH
jgi:hypothetical protein